MARNKSAVKSQPKIYKSLRKRPAVVDEPPDLDKSVDQPQAPRSKKSKKIKGRGFEDLNNFENFEDLDDDMPKKFVQLLNRPTTKSLKSAEGTTTNKGLKNKTPGTNKKNLNERNLSGTNEKKSESATASIAASLKPLPGERLADFNRRVDQALPLVKARGKSVDKLDKKPKKQALTEEQIRAKEDALAEAAIDADMQTQNPFDRFVKSGKDRDYEDPFAHLNAKKKAPKFGEVADRPPDLRLPKKLLKNVPKSAGSMARREMLENERERVIQSYRKLMEKKKLSGGD